MRPIAARIDQDGSRRRRLTSAACRLGLLCGLIVCAAAAAHAAEPPLPIPKITIGVDTAGSPSWLRASPS